MFTPSVIYEKNRENNHRENEEVIISRNEKREIEKENEINEINRHHQPHHQRIFVHRCFVCIDNHQSHRHRKCLCLVDSFSQSIPLRHRLIKCLPFYGWLLVMKCQYVISHPPHHHTPQSASIARRNQIIFHRHVTSHQWKYFHNHISSTSSIDRFHGWHHNHMLTVDVIVINQSSDNRPHRGGVSSIGVYIVTGASSASSSIV